MKGVRSHRREALSDPEACPPAKRVTHLEWESAAESRASARFARRRPG